MLYYILFILYYILLYYVYITLCCVVKQTHTYHNIGAHWMDFGEDRSDKNNKWWNYRFKHMLSSIYRQQPITII